MVYLTGFHAIEEYIKAGRPADALLVAKAGPRAQEIVRLAAGRHIRVDRAGTADLDRVSRDHRGIVLVIPSETPGQEFSFDAFIESLAERKGNVLAVILVEITDQHNFGAIIRSCDQFGADIIITRKARIARQHGDVIARASAGALAWAPLVEVPNLPRALETLKSANFWIYGADMAGQPCYKTDLRGRVALILGGEGAGLSRLLRENCDGLIAIPSAGRVDSLNVSVAAGVLLYEITRQRKSAG
jgi:23S rRNA (guanosine2251-2'-O)-methyltransferase